MPKIYRFNEDREGFGSNLKKLMKTNKFTIESFSEKYNYDENTIKKWRSGKRVPNIDTLKELAAIFNMSIQELYLPNSLFKTEIKEDLKQVLEGKIQLEQCCQESINTGFEYSIYLFQKLLFSFLFIKDDIALKNLFNSFNVTNYGRDKLNLTHDCQYEQFKEQVKNYIKIQHGLSLPYKIDLQTSKTIYSEFNKFIEFKLRRDGL